MWIAWLLACGIESDLWPEPPDPPRPPPVEVTDAQGEAPDDWVTCGSGHFAMYYNLAANEPFVGDLEGDTDGNLPGADPIDFAAVPFWSNDHLASTKYDLSLEFGPNWWPVDEGLANDPRYFATQWTSWLRVFNDDQPVQIVLAAETDVFITIGDYTQIVRTDVRYAPEILDLPLDTGVYPVKIQYAQRKGHDGGFRFRVVNPADQARICWPDFPEEEPG